MAVRLDGCRAKFVRGSRERKGLGGGEKGGQREKMFADTYIEMVSLAFEKMIGNIYLLVMD